MLFRSLFGTKIHAGGLSVVPFQFQKEKSEGTSVEQGFRFDLRYPEARSAYELAVRGRLGEAEFAASKRNLGVEQVFRSDANETGSRTGRSLKIVLYSKSSESKTTNSDAQIVLKDDKHHVYSTIVENNYESVAFLRDTKRIRSKLDRKSTRLNSSHSQQSRMPSSA